MENPFKKFNKYYPKDWDVNLRIMYVPMQIEDLKICLSYGDIGDGKQKLIHFNYLQNKKLTRGYTGNIIQTLDEVFYLHYMNYKFKKEEVIIVSNFLNELIANERKNILEEEIEEEKDICNLSIGKSISNKKTYIMKDNHNGLYKIGFSKNPKIREKTLQSEKPSIEMVKIWDKDIEKHLHKIYDNNRVRGEWFNLNKTQVHYICTHFN